jgi:outer membrane protein OmpA-like peptidoglycan-associated protein
MGLRQGINIILFLVVAWAIVEAAKHHQAGAHQADSIRADLEAAKGLETLTDLEVQVDGPRRTALLRGKVDSAAERERVTEVALGTRGLLTVFNSVEVDAIREELLIDLRKLTEDDPTVGEFNYRIHPDGHTVTLEGWVQEDQPQRIGQITQLVRDVPGVRRIQDNMGVGRPDEDISRIQELIFDILRLGNIYFDYNKATIRPESRDSLSKIAGVLEEYPNVRVRVEGHTDSIASEAYNQRLSEARAASVQSALVELGVDPTRIDTVGHGETRPVAPNDSPEGRAENRRIEFTILRPDEGAAE